MAATTLSINSCLRPSSMPPSSPPLPPNRNMSISTWTMSKDDATSWRSRCVSTMACVVVGATIGLAAAGEGEALAMAGEVREQQATTSSKVLRWSDKRACPPWQANSLESVVPENLPRPLGGRSNRFALYNGTAPATGSSSSVRFSSSRSSSCYSL